MKLLCFTNLKNQILFLSEAYHGSCHDYTMLKNELAPYYGKYLEDLDILVDLGFLGIKKDYSEKVKIPHKKPKKKSLTNQQKAYNKSLSQIRIKVEHAIGGLKRYRILSDRLRMRNIMRYNQIAGLCAALWNFSLIH